nr:trehalose-phosphatase [Brevibacterium marinum]
MPPSQTRPEQTPTPLSAPDFSTPTEVDLRPITGAESVLIALDFDGVLAPLQDDPELSRMLPESARAIRALTTLPGTRVALVSGRDITTLRALADPPESVWLVGSHGAEVNLGTVPTASSSVAPSTTGPSSAAPSTTGPFSTAPSTSAPFSSESSPRRSAEEQRMLEAIDAHIASFEHSLSADPSTGSGTASDGGSGASVRVERKPFSRTVHTRGLDAEFASALHAQVIAVQTEHPGIRVIEGHDITELAVKTATKGDGLRALATADSPAAVLYLGDDVTDEDAFAELEGSRALSGMGIKVGPAPTRAPWRITDPSAVAELLTRLADERRTRQARQ